MHRVSGRFPSQEEVLEPPVFLAGMGRSGTTWMADIINYDSTYRVLFEPFSPAQVPEARAFEYVQYVNPEKGAPELESVAHKILNGYVHNRWVDREGSPPHAKRIIKEIRCNLMLRWLKSLKPAMPVILAMRHPLSVAASWKQLGWGHEAKMKWGLRYQGPRKDFEIITGQQSLLRDFPLIERMLGAIDSQSAFERLIFQWCVLNLVPLQHFTGSDLFVLHYEDILQKPAQTLRRLFSHLGKAPDIDALMPKLGIASSTNYLQRDFVGNKALLTDGWRGHFSHQEIRRARHILEGFGLADYYGDSLSTPSPHIRFAPQPSAKTQDNVLVVVRGGLGNQMFQAVSGLTLATRYGRNVRFVDFCSDARTNRQWELHCFGLYPYAPTRTEAALLRTAERLGKLAFKMGLSVPGLLVDDGHELVSATDPHSARVVIGYWQGIGNVAPLATTVRSLFTFPSSAITNNKVKDRSRVAIHVRRGDYINDPITRRSHLVCDRQYYRDAWALMSRGGRSEALVFSDDPEWAVDSLQLGGAVEYMRASSKTDAWIDMAKMSECDHFIISNSSYSWWAAFLGKAPDKRVICPRYWYPHIETATIGMCPSDWICL